MHGIDVEILSVCLLFLSKFPQKKHKFGYLNTILGKLVGWWLIGKPIVDFLFTLIELSALCVTVQELRGKICIAQLLLQGVDLFALRFYLDKVIPQQPFLASEN